MDAAAKISSNLTAPKFSTMTQQIPHNDWVILRSKMADMPQGSVTPKKKEIYKYTAPWPVYAMNWSLRPDKKFRLALGSFIEDYSNKVSLPNRVSLCRFLLFPQIVLFVVDSSLLAIQYMHVVP